MRRRAIFILLLAVLMPLAMPGKTLAATLEVEIAGLVSDKGDVHVALYDNPDAFPDSDGMRAEAKIVPAGKRAAVTFPGLAPGRYAIAVYHDENGNHDFDQGLFGIPLEDYGFSSAAVAFFGPPSFDAAAFDVTEPETLIRIDLGN